MEQEIQNSMQIVVENDSQQISPTMASEFEIAGSSKSNAKKTSRTNENSVKENKDQRSQLGQANSNRIEKVDQVQANQASDDRKQRSQGQAKSATNSYTRSNGTGNEIQIQRMSNNELSSISKMS